MFQTYILVSDEKMDTYIFLVTCKAGSEGQTLDMAGGQVLSRLLSLSFVLKRGGLASFTGIVLNVLAKPWPLLSTSKNTLVVPKGEAFWETVAVLFPKLWTQGTAMLGVSNSTPKRSGFQK